MLLNCHTYYSFCYGTLSTEQLLHEIKSKGYVDFVLSDINNTSACLDTLRLAPELGLRPVLGIDFRNGVRPCYVGIAKNNQGFRELNEHLSKHLHAAEPFHPIAPEFQHAFVVYPFSRFENHILRPNEFIGVSLQDLQRLSFSPLRGLSHKLVVMQSLTFIFKRHHNAHRLLRAIDCNTLLSRLPREEQAEFNECVPKYEELCAAYQAYEPILKNTSALLEQCEVAFKFGKFSNKNIQHYTGTAQDDLNLLRSECMQAMPFRYPVVNEEINARLEKELSVIAQMDFAAYFLVNWDIVRYARHKNYFYVGRGSGANSMVAYLLRITDVDPIDLDLYFERFINPFRNTPPDFDIDFSWTDREDMTRYIFDRFGRDRTALLGAYSTLQSDAVLRELGKVFGLPAAEIDRLQSREYKAVGELEKLVVLYSQLIQGFPSHLSVHSSGIIISQEPISCYTATILPPKGFPTTQFSMLEAEDIGLYKLDILSQRGLGKIKDAVILIRENKGQEIDIHDIPKFKTDLEVKRLLSKGKCIGCFYIESPAMRTLLAKLEADDYRRLVAASSIIRPGVSRSGMMREYILRYRSAEHREKARAAMPELYDLLSETYGVMVYQEDVIRVAHLFAGLSLAESDYLRRGMSWKFKQRNEFAKVKDSFFNNCRTKGYSQTTVDAIWNQIESFANYAFSKGHSASYAIESYQALYLKAYFPLEYMTATLNNGGGFYRTETYLHEARMHGAIVEAPCVNASDELCTIRGSSIYLGLGMIRELEKELVQRILIERKTDGAFLDLWDFIRRTAVSIEQIRLLIRIGAFRFTGKKKRALLWQAHSLIQTGVRIAREDLFNLEPKKYVLPELHYAWIDDVMDEIELLGFPLCSPYELLRDPLPDGILAAQLHHYIGKEIEVIGYYVTIKPTRTFRGDRMYFGTFLDRVGDWIDTVHFPPSAKAYPMRGPGCYRLRGKVMSEFGVLSIDVQWMERLAQIDRDDLQGRGYKAPPEKQVSDGEIRKGKIVVLR